MHVCYNGVCFLFWGLVYCLKIRRGTYSQTALGWGGKISWLEHLQPLCWWAISLLSVQTRCWFCFKNMEFNASLSWNRISNDSENKTFTINSNALLINFFPEIAWLVWLPLGLSVIKYKIYINVNGGPRCFFFSNVDQKIVIKLTDLLQNFHNFLYPINFLHCHRYTTVLRY